MDDRRVHRKALPTRRFADGFPDDGTITWDEYVQWSCDRGAFYDKGTIYYVSDDWIYHRNPEDGPAVETVFSKKWYLENSLHREGAPAVVISSGQEEWWLHGQRHRSLDEGAAVIYPWHTVEYWEEGRQYFLDDHGVWRG
jgi:hypothetical protein